MNAAQMAQMEAEANEFGMELLMPTKLLLKDMKNGDITDDRWIKKLADKYRVPAATMAIRIGQLSARDALDAWGNCIECPYCGTTAGLRVKCDGGGYIAPDYTCFACFTPQDDGPCFDDLPEVKS